MTEAPPELTTAQAELLAAATDRCLVQTDAEDGREALAAFESIEKDLGDRAHAVGVLAVALVLDNTLRLQKTHWSPSSIGEAATRARQIRRTTHRDSKWAWRDGEATLAACVAVGFVRRWGKQSTPRAVLFQTLLVEARQRRRLTDQA